MENTALNTYWIDHKKQLMKAYTQGQQSFIPYLMPETALQLSAKEVLALLADKIGQTRLEEAIRMEGKIESPLVEERDSTWLKRSNMIGINVRTLQSFWNVAKYTLTIPHSQQAIHLLPIWEPGVVGSLYGMASWHINPEFYSTELEQAVPHLNSVEKQLKAVINILHALGKVVGMDVIPHTDRYSEIVLAQPWLFEWLQREDTRIVRHNALLHQEVQQIVFDFLIAEGSALENLSLPESVEELFSIPEIIRHGLLFGPKGDQYKRNLRRGQLIRRLYDNGFEPLPATMAPPYRGLEVDTSGKVPEPDGEGRIWWDYRLQKPQEMSRVFGPLTRYKLYGRLNDNADWEIDFSQPRKSVWEYVCHHYAAVQESYGFDFMRGDMSHVQMRPAGVPFQSDEWYDIHQAVKKHIQGRCPWFAYYAETFLAAPGYMAYGSELDHLDQSDADVTLGDLQSMVVGDSRFMSNFRWYLDILATRRFAPCFTMMTADKDDPRFDEFYLAGNELRFFIGLFLPDMPSYMGLGFECRDAHLVPAPNEYYSKLYVFQIENGPKSTKGPYRWGNNQELFSRITRMRLLAGDLLPAFANASTHWLIPPDPTAGHGMIAWMLVAEKSYLLVANLDTRRSATNMKIPRRGIAVHYASFLPVFSTHREVLDMELPIDEKFYQLDELMPGEGLVLEAIKALA